MALLTVSEVKSFSRGTIKIGDTLFVDGVPHIQCARCGAIERKYSRGGEVVKRDGRLQRVLKEYKITVGYFVKDETFEMDATGHMVCRVKWHPKLSQRPGCFDCWSAQDKLRGIKRNTPTVIRDGKVVEVVNHLPFYHVRELFDGGK